MKQTLTIADLVAANACYKPEQMQDIFAGRESLTVADVVALDSVPVEDRIWAIVKCLMDDKERRLFACGCAERALARIPNPDQRSVNAVAVARRFANGEATQEELSAAWSAARFAAGDAAGDAARFAARFAAGYAAWSAAWSAAGSAAGDAERLWQLNFAASFAKEASK